MNHHPNGKQTGFFAKYSTVPVQTPEVFSRELLFLFYAAFFFLTTLHHFLGDVRIIDLCTRAVLVVYAPGMLFACGYFVRTRYEAKGAFRNEMLQSALCCLCLYGVLGTAYEVLIRRVNPFLTVKNIIAFIKIPGCSSIFLTLTALFLLCAFLGESLAKWLRSPVILFALCLVGTLFVFVPEGWIGYGLVGIFIGGDSYGCTPIATGLWAFFWGACCADPAHDGNAFWITEKNNRIFAMLSFVAALLFAWFHKKQLCFIFLGLVVAYVGAHFLLLLLPLYQKGESLLKRGASWLWARRNRSSRLRDLIGYTILFCIMATVIFFPYLSEHRTLIWSVDGLGQYVPKVYRFLQYIPEIANDLLHGNLDFKQYDFTTGLGATVAISYDPIYWLNLLFSTSHVETAYSFLILLRYYLAGLAMFVMVLYFKKPRFCAYTASMVYAFCGYALYAGTKHGQFLTPLILLPLLIVAMERLIREKKWYMMTVFVAISLLCSYYFLYMNTIALGIYFLARILFTKEYRSWKMFFQRGLLIAGSYILGAAIGCISLFTSFGSYMGSSRTQGSHLSDFLSTTPLFYRTEWLPDFFISFLSDTFSPGMWLKLGFAPLALFAIVLLFTRKNRPELRGIFLLSTAFCIFPIFGYVFSGFSNVNNRWCYLYAAVIAFILAQGLDQMRKLTGTELGIMTVITALYGLITVLSDKLQLTTIFGAFGLLAITLVVVFLINHPDFSFPKIPARWLLFGITMAAVCFNAHWFVTSGEDHAHLKTYVASGTSMEKMSDTALKNLDQVSGSKTGGFYRSTNLVTSGNTRSSSLLYGYNDLSTFTSTLNGGIVNYNRAMGNCSWNIVSVYDYNFRTYLNTLASVRYIGTSASDKATVPYGYQKVQETKDKKYSIYENQYTLPLGYTYDRIISEETVSSYSAAEKQEASMLSAIVEEEDLSKNSNLTTAESLPLSVKKLPITQMKCNGVTKNGDTLEIAGPGSSITFTFEGEPNAETYLSFQGDITAKKDAKEHFIKTIVKANKVRYLYKFRIDAYSTGQSEFLFHLGYHENRIHTCTLTFQAAGTLKYDDISIYSQSMDSYAERVAALKKNSLTHVKTSSNTVTGDITTDQDKMLVITLPYQSGWTAWVDGKKTEIQRVNYQYMGLNLSAGTHKIRLHYQLPGLKKAVLITCGGLFLFVLIILFHLLKKKKRSKDNELK